MCMYIISMCLESSLLSEGLFTSTDHFELISPYWQLAPVTGTRISINQFSKDVRIPSIGDRLVLYKYAQEVQISKEIV